MGTWQLQEAKAKLSEVIELAAKGGPQTITQRGVATAVVVPIDQWRRMESGNRPTLMELLRSGPDIEIPIPPRGRHRHRKLPVL